MMGCMCKRGFFALRDCGEPIAATCPACGRGICAAHLSPASGYSECLDCHARRADQQTPPATTSDKSTSTGDSDSDWVYGYRDRYYHTGYSPIYSGRYYDSYYDDYDTRTFDRTAASGPVDEGDKPEADFGDS